MQIPYGAVYFRKSNPPREDWARDYQTAREDGLNIFRHWFMWGSIEVAPGVYDWADYDAQMELAQKNNIKTIIAEYLTFPEWLYDAHPDWRYVKSDGKRAQSLMGGSSSTGGFGAGPCLDVPEAREAAGKFLKALALRYKGHPALLGYDVWNECNYPPDVCYCEHTREAFRTYLKEKYKDIKELGAAWHRYSYTSWQQVQPPVYLGMYPETLDWLEFRKANFYEQMQWRIDTIRSVDDQCLISAHGCASAISPMAALGGFDEWLPASKVQVYGFTWVASRRGAEPWKQMHAVDVVRSGARGKPFWHAETQGGPLWLQPQVIGRPREDGRISRPGDIRLWNFVSLMGGTRGFLNPRMRPLLDGPLFGAFGAYGMDGERTPCSQMASRMAKWLNDSRQAQLLAAAPIQGEIGILVAPEVPLVSRMLATEGKWDFYADMMWGAYKAFFDNNIQADWVHIDDIDRYDTLYFPYPVMLKQKTVDKLCAWVEAGGTLICEGCPGYFGDGAHVAARQPRKGLAELFGVDQEYVEFTPDLLETLDIKVMDKPLAGGTFLQVYRMREALPCGQLEDGRTVAAENRYGKGKTLLIGTFPSEAYLRRGDENTRRFFGELLAFAGKQPYVRCDNHLVKARLQRSADAWYLWAVNYGEARQKANIAVLKDLVKITSFTLCYADSLPELDREGVLHCDLGPQDALIVKLGG